MTRVYLAGGYKSGWQDKLKDALKEYNFKWFDPKVKERPKSGSAVPMSLEEYGTWDLHHIRQSDIVFAYAERTNPSCIGLAVEIGYAYGIGKTVILVLESGHQTIEDRYLLFLSKAASITFSDFGTAMNYLLSYHDPTDKQGVL